MTTEANRTGHAAAAAGVLMTAGVAGEWLLNPQRDDGTVTNTPVFALLLITSTVGFALLAYAVRRLGRESIRRTRPARTGAWMSMVGAGLLTVFGAMVLVTGVVSGSPAGVSFLAFALGMLMLSIGPVTWGLSLRTERPGMWQVLVVAGGAAFASIAIPLDPWHDITLIGMFAAWSVIGLLVLRGRDSGALPLLQHRVPADHEQS